jgi:hypothetical protein
LLAGPGSRNPDIFSGKRTGGVDIYRAVGDGFRHGTRENPGARNQFLRGKQFRTKRRKIKFQQVLGAVIEATPAPQEVPACGDAVANFDRLAKLPPFF